MLAKELEITNKLGLHVRAATKLVQAASLFDLDINIMCNGQSADAKSIMEVLMLAGVVGSIVTLEATGDDPAEEERAIATLSELFINRFDEKE